MRSTFIKNVVSLLQATFKEWQNDNCLQMGASLAYYALFSLFPLILIILSVIGFIVGPDSGARQQILTIAQENFPEQAYGLVESTLDQLNSSRTGAGLIGFFTLLLSASGIFTALDQSFDVMWKIDRANQPKLSIVASVLSMAQKRFLAFSLVIGSAFIMLASMILNVAVGVVLEVANNLAVAGGVPFWSEGQALLLQIAPILVSLLLLTIAFMLLFRFLPDTKITWGDVWAGALITALLFILVQQLISGVGISIGSNFQSYGAIGGVMALMLWIYLISQILFIGAEFTYVYSTTFGSAASTSKHAVTAAADAVRADTASIATPPPVETVEQRTAVAASIGLLVGALGVLAVAIGSFVVGVQRVMQFTRRKE